MKRILITGVNSYVGNAVEEYLLRYNGAEGRELYRVDKISLRDDTWERMSLGEYDTIFHVAGLAHADVGNISAEGQQEYYRVNRDLTLQVAARAKEAGVAQFIYMSSVILYGDSAPVGQRKQITEQTEPAPENFYGDSKLQAEKGLEKLKTEEFRVANVRAPMIYGRESKGNYRLLERLAEKLPFFPSVQNERSMIYIENLAEFVRLLIESGEGGIYFPQNKDYVSTAELVRCIAEAKGKKILSVGILNPFVKLAGRMPGKIGGLTNKAFGSLTVDQELSHRGITDYCLYDMKESVRRIERL